MNDYKYKNSFIKLKMIKTTTQDNPPANFFKKDKYFVLGKRLHNNEIKISLLGTLEKNDKKNLDEFIKAYSAECSVSEFDKIFVTENISDKLSYKENTTTK
jgi:hypothetical protein